MEFFSRIEFPYGLNAAVGVVNDSKYCPSWGSLIVSWLKAPKMLTSTKNSFSVKN